ncbi:MAG TPA: 4-(cytidine 5'-diphospho)-2-C-methyl-D-erythritol kinase [Opitutaceae bacterium]|jgi:4-diphosphocytidyl-2-C-methyl-D-erythritol kinase|nr:4-(cytidine 5'-diphospho)-2-C-methyl-D-erythritol kinase [Opitutaceae bacterium]
MGSTVLFSPAKINLFLAVTGRRADGYHELVSVVVPVDFGDTLGIETRAGDEFTLECADPAVPRGESNLVLKAARLFAEMTGRAGGAAFFLEKRIPIGAGLGGGSSNAVAALRGLNFLAGEPLDAAALAALAARIGSDCALFLPGGPVVMRGRGERVEPLAVETAARLRGRRMLLFKPGFGIGTPWAYAQLAAAGEKNYLPAAEAEARLAAWSRDARAPAEAILFNSFERPVFQKFPALPVLLENLAAEFGLAAHMSGSGSACFAFLPDGVATNAVAARIHEAWGMAALVVETKIC